MAKMDGLCPQTNFLRATETEITRWEEDGLRMSYWIGINGVWNVKDEINTAGLWLRTFFLLARSAWSVCV